MVEIICNNYLLYTLMGVFVLGVLSRLILVIGYNGLRRSTYNMSNPDNRLLKQIKLKYESYDKLEIPITNTVAFTKRAMYEHRICGMSLRFLEKVLGQALFWCVTIGVLAVGSGYFLDISVDVIVLYGVSSALFSVLLYNIDKVSDIEYVRENIEICIVDFLENHMRGRLPDEEEISAQESCLSEEQEEYMEDVNIAAAVTESDNDKKAAEEENNIIEEVLSEIFC